MTIHQDSKAFRLPGQRQFDQDAVFERCEWRSHCRFRVLSLEKSQRVKGLLDEEWNFLPTRTVPTSCGELGSVSLMQNRQSLLPSRAQDARKLNPVVKIASQEAASFDHWSLLRIRQPRTTKSRIRLQLAGAGSQLRPFRGHDRIYVKNELLAVIKLSRNLLPLSLKYAPVQRVPNFPLPERP